MADDVDSNGASNCNAFVGAAAIYVPHVQNGDMANGIFKI